MDADWYVDPVGRFDGRFFDGQEWTSQVSDSGKLAVDPDWPLSDQLGSNTASVEPAVELSPQDPLAAQEALGSVDEAAVVAEAQIPAEPVDEFSATDAAVTAMTGAAVSAVDDEALVVSHAELPTSPPMAVADAPQVQVPSVDVVPSASDVPEFESPSASVSDAPLVHPNVPSTQDEAPAVSPFDPDGPLRADLAVESPARQVAVVDHSVLGTSEPEIRSESATATAQGSPQRKSTQWLYALAFAVVVLGVLGLVVPRLIGGDDPTVDESQQGIEIDQPEGLVDAGAQFDADELVQVGSLALLNGASVLDDLAEWHQDYAADRGVELRPNASCWFGRLGDAAVPQAQCGPVGGSADTEFLFDKVPLRFDEADGGQIAQPVVDATTNDSVLPRFLELIGSANGPVPPEVNNN